jgi:hypothetical protein
LSSNNKVSDDEKVEKKIILETPENLIQKLENEIKSSLIKIICQS